MGKKNRRQNREGSLYQRASDGRWVAVHFAGYKPNGKPDRREFYGQSPDEALEKKAKFLDAQKAGFTPPKGKGRGDNLGEFLTHWLYHIKRKEVRETTWHNSYRPKAEKHLIAKLGYLRLPDLAEEHVEEWMTGMSGDGYSPTTILQCLGLLSQALDVAVRRKLIPRNVCHYVSPPPQVEQEPLPPERDEAQLMLAALRDRRNGARWALALALGPRRGETLGLTWPMLDLTNLDAATVRIAWELVRIPWQHGCDDPHKCGARHHVAPCPPDCAKGKRLQGGRPHQCRLKVCPKGCGGGHQGRCAREWCPPDCEGHAKACPLKRGGGLVLTEPKSEKSKRAVVIPRPLAEWLVLHQLAQAEEREAGGLGA